MTAGTFVHRCTAPSSTSAALYLPCTFPVPSLYLPQVHRAFLDKRGPLSWPAYVQISGDHTHPRWRFQGHRRLKNMIVLMEWVPDVDSAAAAAAYGAEAGPGAALAETALSEGQRTRLSRVFEMYDAEGRSALGEERLRLVMKDMGLLPDEIQSERIAVEGLFTQLRMGGAANVDPSDGSLRVSSFEFLRLMQSQAFMTAETGRD